jgi:hypothetical protein
MGTTWGDGPPERIQVPNQRTAIGPVAAAGPRVTHTDLRHAPSPRLERALADLRHSLDQWHHGEAPDLGVIDATRLYLAALDAEGTDPP